MPQCSVIAKGLWKAEVKTPASIVISVQFVVIEISTNITKGPNMLIALKNSENDHQRIIF